MLHDQSSFLANPARKGRGSLVLSPTAFAGRVRQEAPLRQDASEEPGRRTVDPHERECGILPGENSQSGVRVRRDDLDLLDAQGIGIALDDVEIHPSLLPHPIAVHANDLFLEGFADVAGRFASIMRWCFK